MRTVYQLISWIALAATVLPSVLFYTGTITSLDLVKWAMTVAMLAWFLATPLWMGREADRGKANDGA